VGLIGESGSVEIINFYEEISYKTTTGIPTKRREHAILYPKRHSFSKVHLLYEPEDVIPCIGNFTEEKSCGRLSE
jgi:hypothetical protein